MPADPTPVPPEADRKTHIDLADAECRIDGLFRDPKTDVVFQAYATGEIEATAIVARLHVLLGI